MTPKRKMLLDLIEKPDEAFSMSEAQLLPLRLAAAQELFSQRIEQIPLLKQRAQEAGISKIEKLSDLVPLLFSHTAYKSYPASFVEKGQWDRLLKWLDSLSVLDLSGVDVSTVTNVDEWLERLWAADHRVLATSGSSGKCSFLNHTAGDQANKKRHFKYCAAWPVQVASRDRPVFWMGQIKGPNSAVEAGQFAMENWGREGAVFTLTQEPLRISEVSKMASMRKKMADGTATPTEVAEFEAESVVKGQQGTQEMREFADRVLDHRHEPIYLIGFWAQHLAIIERARERGIANGDFHPDSIIGAGGGVKGIPLPADYREQVNAFYGNVRRPGLYAMTELSQPMPRCEHGHYHVPPGLIMLLLDESGETLLNPEAEHKGIKEGRFAFLDLAYEGRWGGLITGDKVSVDFTPTCSCGRPGPVIHDTIVRFTQMGQEDNIGCAGTIDAYIRGSIA
ncbi:hypothetical protein JFU37_01590 [Pseudomonas sp. TH41]|uniref:hypothetical protein n=1 Tax=Pseudomonas sp. TH41 TaxID=2796405 RepID=UPI00191465E7|nr:hypothetical protein [Pseudomonas sp. TH41]MBK5351220.1 hypothetical protein [Pseudomonas sp. TH41]